MVLRVRGYRRLLFIFSITLFVPFVFLAQDQQARLAVVDVELLIRGPDGAPVANSDVTIKIPDLPSVPDITTKTDSHGNARFRVPYGAFRLSVEAHGIGHGDIGTTEFVAGHVAHPPLSPLAAYGSIDGTFPDGFCAHDITIEAASSGYSYRTIKVKPDSPGHFHISDVPDGYWTVKVFAGTQLCAAIQASFPLAAGQNLRSVDVPYVSTTPPQATVLTSPAPAAAPAPKGPVVWVRGTVRDDRGKPIAGACVMALATYSGSIRMYQLTSQAVADAEGRYELKGEGGLPYFSATLVATAPGHPPAWAWPSFPQLVTDDSKPAKPPEPPTQDLVLPSKSGKMNVTVVVDGQPVADIYVALYLENANLRDMWAMPRSDATAIQDAAYPVAKTNTDGVASFENLLPGSYRVLATKDKNAVRWSLYGMNDLRGWTAQSTGIPVQVGETTNYKISLYEQKNTTGFRPVMADGATMPASGVAYGPVDDIWWTTNEGPGKVDLKQAGLWRIEATYIDAPGASSSNAGPYLLAAGHVAISPNLENVDPPVFTARRIEPPSARILVQDVNGKPIHVTVHVTDYGNSGFSATTDDHGEALFTGLSVNRKYFVELTGAPGTDVKMIDGGKFLVHPAGQPFVNGLALAYGPDSPIPPPQELHAEPAIKEKTFITEANTEYRVMMRQDRLHYIYGAFHAPADDRRGKWVFSFDFPQVRLGAHSGGRASTDEFVAGPFFPGELKVAFGPISAISYHTTVNVPADDSGPIHFDIDVEKFTPQPPEPPDPMEAAPETVMMGMSGISAKAGGANKLTGKVYLSDGKTPALGAQVLYVPRHQRYASISAMADALGNLQPRGLWHTGNTGVTEKDSGPDSPVVVAFLPGSCGATVQTEPLQPGQALHLVLPSPIRVTGQVTVGGVSPLHRLGVIHVLAAHQGKGALDQYLSVATTADAEGHFTLAGLTPGEYQVQATLDDVWLSPPISMHVGNHNPKPLNLAIPLPGAAVRVDVRDPEGKPVVATSVTLDRDGPMEPLWPGEWTTDGAGSVYFPTLEAGEHTIHVVGAAEPIKFTVPPLPSPLVIVPVKLKENKPAIRVKVIDDYSPYQPN